MEKERFDELLEIQRKATVFKRNSNRFERLEHFMHCFLGMQSFTAEERQKLVDQFTGLSDSERETVIYNATHEPHPAYFSLSGNEADKLNNERRDLSLHERARLFKFFEVYGGHTVLDLGEVFSARIDIDDHSSPERNTKPYAHVSFSDGYNRRVETIDILASVRQNASAIGHPAITAAISYWQRSIYFKNLRNRKNSDDDGPWLRMYRDHFSRRPVKVAEDNLRALSEALDRGAHDRSLDEKTAVVVELERLELDNENGALHLAWKKLKKWQPSDSDLLKFEEELRNESERDFRDGVRLPSVIRFLRDKSKTGGYRFVGARQPSWDNFRNAFEAWHFKIAVHSIKNYPSQVRKKNPDFKEAAKEAVATRFDLINLFHSTLAMPLVFARPPVWLSEHDIGLNLEDAIAAKCHPKIA